EKQKREQEVELARLKTEQRRKPRRPPGAGAHAPRAEQATARHEALLAEHSRGGAAARRAPGVQARKAIVETEVAIAELR
ncbi:SPFH domain-containing protein, partial [Pyxidicoccus sp. 3LFB2]